MTSPLTTIEKMILPNERRVQDRRGTNSTLESYHVNFAMLEQMGRLIILLDKKAQVIYKTPKIQVLLQTGGLPLSLQPKFTLHEKGNALHFQECLNGINDARQVIETACTLILKSPPPRKSLSLSLFHLPNKDPQNHAMPRILVMFCDPTHPIEQQWLSFQQQLGLTAAESRLCIALSDGLSISDYCNKYKVSANTARSHLKNIFDKTATHRQTELLQLIFLYTRS